MDLTQRLRAFYLTAIVACLFLRTLPLQSWVAKCRPLTIDSFQYTLMSDNGILSPEPLMDQLRRNKIPYLVLQNALAKLYFYHHYEKTATRSVSCVLQTYS